MSRRKAFRELVRLWLIVGAFAALLMGPFALLSQLVNPDWLGGALGILWVVVVISGVEYRRMRG